MRKFRGLLSVGLAAGSTVRPTVDWNQFFDFEAEGLLSQRDLEFIDFLGELRDGWDVTSTATQTPVTTTTQASSATAILPVKRSMPDPGSTSPKRKRSSRTQCSKASNELRCAVIIVMMSSKQPANDEKLMARVHEECPLATLEDVQAIQSDLRMYTVQSVRFHDLVILNPVGLFSYSIDGDLVKHILVWRKYCIEPLNSFHQLEKKGWRPCIVDEKTNTVRLSHGAMNRYLRDELNALF